MTDQYVQIPTDSTGKKIDTEELTVSAQTVQRQRIRISGAAAADLAGCDSTNGLDVDVTRVIPGTSATHLGKAEDAVHSSGDTGVMALGVRQDTPAVLCPAGDYHPFTVDAYGRMQVGAGKNIAVITTSLTRPADTTAYTAGDAITDNAGTKLTFANVARLAAGSGQIKRITLIDSANVATKPDVEIWLFDTSFTPDTDNAAFTPTDAEMETLICVIAFGTAAWNVGTATAGAGGNAMIEGALSHAINFKCTGSLTDIYGALVVRNAYVPVSQEKFTIRLHIEQD